MHFSVKSVLSSLQLQRFGLEDNTKFGFDVSFEIARTTFSPKSEIGELFPLLNRVWGVVKTAGIERGF